MSHAAGAFRLELLQLYRSVPSSRVFSHIFRVRVPPERSPIYRNVPPFSSLTPRTIVGSHQTSEGNAIDLALSHGAAWGEETICTMRLKVVVPHRKERGHSNGRYHDWRSWNHPTRRSESRTATRSRWICVRSSPRGRSISPTDVRATRAIWPLLLPATLDSLRDLLVL